MPERNGAENQTQRSSDAACAAENL